MRFGFATARTAQIYLMCSFFEKSRNWLAPDEPFDREDLWTLLIASSSMLVIIAAMFHRP